MLSDSPILVHFSPKCNKNFTISKIFPDLEKPWFHSLVGLGKTAYNDYYKFDRMGEKDVEGMTLESAAALFRACDCAMLCTQGGRVAFANPAAVTALGEDPTGQSAAAVLPERLLKLQGKLGAASAKIRDRDAVDIVDAVFRDPLHLRKSRDKGELFFTGGLQQRGKLRACVAAERGVRLFVDHRYTGQKRARSSMEDRVVRCFRRKMAAVGVDDQDFRTGKCRVFSAVFALRRSSA